MKTNFKRLAACIAAPLAVGGLAAVLTKDNMVMFELINKPPLSPPGWLFPRCVDDTVYPHGACVLLGIFRKRFGKGKACGAIVLRAVACVKLRMADTVF